MHGKCCKRSFCCNRLTTMIEWCANKGSSLPEKVTIVKCQMRCLLEEISLFFGNNATRVQLQTFCRKLLQKIKGSCLPRSVIYYPFQVSYWSYLIGSMWRLLVSSQRFLHSLIWIDRAQTDRRKIAEICERRTRRRGEEISAHDEILTALANRSRESVRATLT